jgi:hypothetical protein
VSFFEATMLSGASRQDEDVERCPELQQPESRELGAATGLIVDSLSIPNWTTLIAQSIPKQRFGKEEM